MSDPSGVGKVAVAVFWPTLGCTATSAGQVMDGATLSRTMTLNEHEDDRPALSNAVQDTFEVVATANWLPERGVHDMLLTPEPSAAEGVGL